jgi:hypothetical protein
MMLEFIGLTSDMIMIENDGRRNITDLLKKYLLWPMLVGNSKFKEATKDYVEHRIHQEIKEMRVC